jgi:hypothetical protein
MCVKSCYHSIAVCTALLCALKISAYEASIRVSPFVAAFLLVPAVFHGQSVPVSGVVVDSASAPIIGAEVSVSASGAASSSGEHGEFRFTAVPPGRIVVRARRLGFKPDSVVLTVGDRAIANVSIRMVRTALALAPVTVRARKGDFTGRLAGYYERLERQSGGYFITRAQIDRENSRSLSQLLQSVPAMRGSRGRAGSQGVRMRGRTCWPLVWLDGSPMPSGDVDLDGIPPNTIQGIELYLGSTTAPTRYSAPRDLSSCGTILIWSRGPDTDPLPPRRGSVNLERLVASLSVYTAEQVDSAAKVKGAPIVAAYPPSLMAEGLSGRVVAEFIVGVDGRMEAESFGWVTSTHPLFTDAARRALEHTEFVPAIKDGRLVRQIINQLFIFAGND